MTDAELKAELDRRFDGVAELIKQVAERLESRNAIREAQNEEAGRKESGS